ncbi:hypothetical protein ACCAA_1000007 [Candidatus Accumulibacter aalborgensis]|uniref:Response regulatory domain-containing protein n=1 Tax=Candidatus Accumulibacter aalborgensis TaxID=1860102 RepID=A0A1A8XDV6_9PROT|nr:hypothetical protein ACCAA_1000007 [Candidatus Accumulibacter aalborgensis]
MSKTAADSGRIRVLVVDDQALIRRGMTLMLSLEADIEVVGQASDGIEAVALAESLTPDVVLMDLHMPRKGGGRGDARDHDGAAAYARAGADHPGRRGVRLRRRTRRRSRVSAQGRQRGRTPRNRARRPSRRVAADAADCAQGDGSVSAAVLPSSGAPCWRRDHFQRTCRHDSDGNSVVATGSIEQQGRKDPRPDRRGQEQQADRGRRLSGRRHGEELRQPDHGKTARQYTHRACRHVPAPAASCLTSVAYD